MSLIRGAIEILEIGLQSLLMVMLLKLLEKVVSSAKPQPMLANDTTGGGKLKEKQDPIFLKAAPKKLQLTLQLEMRLTLAIYTFF